MCLILTLDQPAGPTARSSSSAPRSSAPSASCASWPRSRIRLSPNWNPIRCYDHMVAKDDVVYVPFAFGYVNYAARRPTPPHLAFADVPRPGVGGRPARRRRHRRQRPVENREAAIDYALYLCSPQIQRATMSRAGGQPGSLRRGRTRGQRGDRAISSPTRCGPSRPPISGQRMRASSPSSATAHRAPRPPSPARCRPTELAGPTLDRVYRESWAAADEPRGASPDGGDRQGIGERGEGGRSEYRAPAAEKALDILELMADQAEGLTQTEIATGLGRSIHEIYRILHPAGKPRLSSCAPRPIASGCRSSCSSSRTGTRRSTGWSNARCR